jgi:hypothetical protein
MKRTDKTDTSVTPSPWDDATQSLAPISTVDTLDTHHVEDDEDHEDQDTDYTIDGLMNDFPTAKELQQFVYTQTNGEVSLNLQGRSNQLKYNLALDALAGKKIPLKYLSKDNPYMEKTDLVPEEELRDAPPRHPDCPDPSTELTRYNTSRLPHPDAQSASQGHFCSCLFRSYRDGTVTYEIIGPVDKREEGQRLNKFGHMQPALIRWIDPRTGEQILQYPNGTFTPVGQVLHEKLQKLDGVNIFSRYIKRSLGSVDRAILQNPWKAGR